jgi:mRNA-degrading endonuclease RelE of RelBE toxin-antitoxin system
MSASEIIEQIKRLPAEEREQVKDFLDHADSKPSPRAVQYIPRATLEKSADKIFTKYDKLFRKLAQ